LNPASQSSKSKFSIPKLRQTLVHRPRLLGQLQDGVQRSLTLVSAPPGFGKTTLLVEWAAGESQPVAWFSLDSGDNDPVRFATNLVAACDCVRVGGLTPLTSPDQSLPPQFILQTLLVQLDNLTTDTVLVLDDYHVIQSSPVHELVAFLLEHPPVRLHLILATRADPPIPLARLRAQGELKELRADDLRFTGEEAALFLQDLMGLPITPEDVSVLEIKTEGWISGLQLAALSMQGRKDIESFVQTFSGSHRYILDYLVEEVLSRQPVPIQQFLLQTSILEELSAPLCSAVTGMDSDAQTTLEYLERANIFTIPLDDDRHWYRYHHLFADLLRVRLGQSSPELVPALHQRAALWLDQHGFTIPAVQHALAAKDFTLAAELMQAHSAERWSMSDISFLNQLAQLPREVLQTRPVLGVHRAWTLVLQSRLDEAGALLDSLLPHIPAGGTPATEELSGFVTLLLTYIHTLTLKPGHIELPAPDVLELVPRESLAMRNSADVMYARLLSYQGRFEEAVGILLNTVQRDITANGTTAIPICISTVVRLRFIQGRLSEADSLCRAYIEHISQRDRRRYYTSGLLEIALAEVLLERNDLAVAEALALDGLQHNKPWNIPQSILLGYLRLVQVQLAQGSLNAAEETLKTAESFMPIPARPPDLEHEFRILHLTLDTARGKHISSQEWAGDLPDEFSSDYRFEYDYLLLARLLIAEKRFSQAVHLLEALQTLAETGQRIGRLVKILLLQALTYAALGRKADAFISLAKCLDLAAPECFLRTFLDEGDPAKELLAAYQRHPKGTQREYLGHILDSFPKSEAAPAHVVLQQNLISPLTPRELDVLRCLAQGASNQAIAEELFITINSVKKHTGNIYRKLDASSRTQAIARGRELGLIE
jgi:LuxR family transcriptional regulator, maltose regulon positive regulatory protein